VKILPYRIRRNYVASSYTKTFGRKRWREEEERFPIPKIVENSPIPCVLYPGYYYIPWVDSRVVINRKGMLVKLSNGKTHNTHFNHRGYLRTALRVGNAYKTFPVHRIVAMLFCSIPERHRDKTFDDLEVNHINADKTDNNCVNLEWVSGLENMRHAWKYGLISTEKAVLEKNVETGVVRRIASLSECARIHVLSTSAVSSHLRSKYAGMILINGCYLKNDDQTEWPETTTVNDVRIKIGMSCDCIGENVLTGQRLVFTSLSQACRFLDLPLTPLRLSRSRKGVEVPFQNWIFYSLSGLPLSKKLKGDRHHTLPF
jgi:hypothetical protein